MSAPDDENLSGQDEDGEGGGEPDAPLSPSPVPVSLGDLDRAPVNLPTSNFPVSQADYDELRAKFTQVSNEKVGLLSDIDELNKRVQTHEILDALIQPYADRTFTYMCCYSAGVAFLLLLSGGNVDGFHLDKDVLVLLVGSTAVTVIGLVGMVLTGIFVGARGRK